jgi:hypothetical protein
VREAVKKRLGYDPFFPSADKTIVARVLRDATQLRGEVELIDEHGIQVGRREFAAPLEQCDQLVRAIALSISIAIDPQSAETYSKGPKETVAADPPENQPDLPGNPVTQRALVAAVPRATTPAKPALALLPWLWSAGLGPTLQFQVLPRVALGAAAFAALRSGAWSLALEGELALPVTTTEDDVELRSSSFALRVVPCGHWGVAFACQVTALRWLSATGSASDQGGSAFSLALGARLGAEVPLSGSFGVLGYGDLLLTPMPVQLRSEGSKVWEMPVASGGLGIAGVLHFR